MAAPAPAQRTHQQTQCRFLTLLHLHVRLIIDEMALDGRYLHATSDGGKARRVAHGGEQPRTKSLLAASQQNEP